MTQRVSFLMREHFEVVAGEKVVEIIRASHDRIPRSPNGLHSESLCELQRHEASQGFIGVEIVQSNYGSSVRYDSGLQNFGLVASARTLGGTYEAALSFTKKWVAQDPTHRYAWRRRK